MNSNILTEYDDKFIINILEQTKNIAMVGLSSDWNRPSYFVAKYLTDRGYNIFPVNPKEWAEKKGWHTTIDIKTEVHGYNGKTANIISSGKRVKKDRTLIEEYSAFYAFKKIGSEWKMYAISQVINND